MKHLAVIIGKESREYILSSYEKTVVNLLDLADAADDLGIKCLSVHLFGKELIFRSVAERMRVSGVLADFFENALLNAIGSRGYKVRFLGEIRLVQPELLRAASKLNAAGMNNTGMTLALALAYNPEDELAQAVNYVLAQKSITADTGPLWKNELVPYLYSANLPQTDAVLVYGARRQTVFMPLISDDAALVFADKPFADFSKKDVYDAVKQYRLQYENS